MMNDIKLLELNESYKIMESCNSLFNIGKEEMNILIENAASESNFSKWLYNWDKFIDYRCGIKKRYDLNMSPTVYSILDFINLTTDRVVVKNRPKDSYIMLDNPNDLNEIHAFLFHSLQFVKNLTKEIYGNGITISVPKEQSQTIRELEDLVLLLRNNGFIYSLYYHSLAKKIKLNNSVTIYLVNNESRDFFIQQNQNNLFIDISNLKKKIDSHGDLLVQTINSMGLANLYSENQIVLPMYEEKSREYQVDLSWNHSTKRLITEKNYHNIYRCSDGYIASSGGLSALCFRPTWEEMSRFLAKH